MKALLIGGSLAALAVAAGTSAVAQTAGGSASSTTAIPPTAAVPPVQEATPSPPAAAAPSAAAPSPTVGEIVVTANKRAQNLNDVAESVTAVSGSQLRALGINDVQDLVKVTPGLSYVESGNSVPVFSLRGVGFFDTALGARPTVSVYTDEAPLPFSIEAQGAAFDLERVEVLKGPQGTLFGQNATGGAINYIAAKPENQFGAGLTASYARFNTADVQGYVTGPITDTLNGRIAIHTIQGGPWQQSYTRDAQLGDQNFTQGRILLDWRPTSKLKVSLNLNGFIDHSDTQAGQLIGIVPVSAKALPSFPLLTSYPLSPRDDRAADWDANSNLMQHNSFYQGNLRFDYEINDSLTLTSITSYSRASIIAPNDIDGTALTSTNTQVNGSLSTASEELRLAGRTRRLNWLIGANFEHDRTYEQDFLYFPYATALHAFSPIYNYDSTSPVTAQTFNTTGIFGNFDYNLTSLFTLHGGARFTQANLGYNACTRVEDASSGEAITSLFNILRTGAGEAPIAPLQAGQCQTLDATLTPSNLKGNLDQNNVSWKVGLDYKPFRHTLLYFNVSRGYKQGSSPVLGAINIAELAPVAQESVLAYEVGAKSSLLNHKMDISGALFYYDYTDKQLLGRAIEQPNLLGALQALVNVPQSRIQGAEGQVSIYPIRGLTLTAGATYIDSRIEGHYINYTILGQQADFGGESFPYTPQFQLVLDGEYEFPITNDLGGVAGFNYNYRSKTSAGFGDDPLLNIRSYGLLDLHAGLESQNKKWRIEAFGRNVTNTYYWTNVAKYNDVVRRLAGYPVTYGVQLSYKY